MVDVLSGWSSARLVEFGNFECVYITFFKYEDVDSDGRYDPAIDNPVDNWVFALRSLGGESFEVTTDINGEAVVRFCTADSWMVVEELEDGWCLISPENGYYTFEVVSGHSWQTPEGPERYLYEFGNFRCVEIEIFKFWDKCSDGFFSDGLDEPLGKWYFEVIGVDNDYYEYGWTDGDGYLSFTVCMAGTYIVREYVQEGWTPIMPLSGYYEFYIESGMGLIPLNFANYQYVDVPIFKYEDRDSDGEYDEGYDVPLEDWYFELIRHGDGYVFSGYTDINGELVLSVNRSGVYTLREEDRAGWSHIEPASGEMLLSIVGGTEVEVRMFGNFHDVCLEVFKYENFWGDGEYDDDVDVGLEGWNFTVFGPGLPVSGVRITTDASGHACLVVNRSGVFTVVEETRTGWTPTTDTTQYAWVESGYASPGLLCFGNWKWFDITVFKYEDVNGNGEFDAGDIPLPGWDIYVYGWPWSYDSSVALDEVTDGTGHANFTITVNGGQFATITGTAQSGATASFTYVGPGRALTQPERDALDRLFEAPGALSTTVDGVFAPAELLLGTSASLTLPS
jgi:hypothetical protein